MKVGFIGLGLMGTSMTANLLAAGHTVLGFDVEEARRTEHVDRGGEVADSVAEVAAQCSVMMLSLPNSDIGMEVCLGEGSIATAARRGSLVIDTTTTRPRDTLAMAEGLAAVGVRMIDATVSGNAAQAARGDLVAMVGGAEADLEEARPVLEAISRSIRHLGPIGSGATAKLIINLALGIHRLALAEALVMGERAGIDLEVLLDVLRDGAAYSRAMDLWGERMVSGEYLPPASRVRQSHKDFRLIVEQGHALGSPTFLASVVRQLLQMGEGVGLGDLDNSSIIELLRRGAGIGRM